jgi:hypothetical protein
VVCTLGSAASGSVCWKGVFLKSRNGGKNELRHCDVPLPCNKKQRPCWISIRQGDARLQSAREDNGEKNECSGHGIVSDDNLKIRVGDQFFKNWAINSPILAPYWHAHWMPACQYGARIGA